MNKQLVFGIFATLGLTACGGGRGHEAVFNGNARADGFAGLEQPAAYTGMAGVSVSEMERTTFELINEVRTRGTLRGAPVSALGPTCTPGLRPALQESGLLSKLAQGHAQYLGLNGKNAASLHEQKAGSPLFTGADFNARNAAAFKAAGISSFQPRVKTSEIITTYNYRENDPAALAVKNWLRSKAHCPVIFNPEMQRVGIGHSIDTTGKDPNRHNFTLVAGSLIR